MGFVRMFASGSTMINVGQGTGSSSWDEMRCDVADRSVGLSVDYGVLQVI